MHRQTLHQRRSIVFLFSWTNSNGQVGKSFISVPLNLWQISGWPKGDNGHMLIVKLFRFLIPLSLELFMCTSILQKPTPFWVLGLRERDRERKKKREDLALKPCGIANKSFFAPVKGLGFKGLPCTCSWCGKVRGLRFTLFTRTSVVKCEIAKGLLPLVINHGIKYFVFGPL